MTTATQIGNFNVWYCPQRQTLRQSDANGNGDFEYEAECFSRSEQATAHSILATATQTA